MTEEEKLLARFSFATHFGRHLGQMGRLQCYLQTHQTQQRADTILQDGRTVRHRRISFLEAGVAEFRGGVWSGGGGKRLKLLLVRRIISKTGCNTGQLESPQRVKKDEWHGRTGRSQCKAEQHCCCEREGVSGSNRPQVYPMLV